MSHTTRDYVNGDPELWIIHNSDFSGECYVRWKLEGKTFEWKVDGDELLNGNIQGAGPFYTEFDNEKKLGQVPPCVIGRAVQLAVRTILSRKIINFIGDL